MPVYFFNLLRKGELIADDEGTELPDAGAVHREAVLTARDMIISTLRADELFPPRDGVRVTDEQGSEILTITLKEALGLD